MKKINLKVELVELLTEYRKSEGTDLSGAIRDALTDLYDIASVGGLDIDERFQAAGEAYQDELEMKTLEGNDMKVDRLLKMASEVGIADDDLDEAVYDAAQESGLGTLNTIEGAVAQESHIAGKERSASDINNGGLESQIRYLLEGGTTEADIEKMINRS